MIGLKMAKPSNAKDFEQIATMIDTYREQAYTGLIRSVRQMFGRDNEDGTTNEELAEDLAEEFFGVHMVHQVIIDKVKLLTSKV